MPDPGGEMPVVHHIQLCVLDPEITLQKLKKFGFTLYAKRITLSTTLVARLGSVFFIITERKHTEIALSNSLSFFEHSCTHEVDTVFNVGFSVKKSDVIHICEEISRYEAGGEIIVPPTEITDKYGTLLYAIVKSNCGNVLHSIFCTAEYTGAFLPGYDIIETSLCGVSKTEIFGVDHVTLACHSGNSTKVIDFYEKCFGMHRFEISSNDDEKDGLILADGVGLRLRAMKYWRCAEIGLNFCKETKNSFMLVVVESLEGQTNCNVETFLKEHRGEGVEHLALSTKKIIDAVSKLKDNGVRFRNPPRAYYDELRNNKKLLGLSEDLNTLSKLGILLDNEDDSTLWDERIVSTHTPKKYLMQIFARPLFDSKTFFIEIIQRSGAKGLGSGNILALVRSIREEERRNTMKNEAKTQEISKEHFTCPRQC